MTAHNGRNPRCHYLSDLPGRLLFHHHAGRIAGPLAVFFVLSSWFTFPAQAAEDGSPPFGVSIEVTFESLDLVASSSAPMRVEVGQLATVTVVIESGSAGGPVVVDDPSDLLEIERSSGSRTRFADLVQISDGKYRVDVALSEVGTWRFVALPDLEDRSLLPPGSTDEVVVIVEAAVGQDSSTDGNSGIAILGGLFLVVVALVLYFTRGKLPGDHRPTTPPVSHDTWWNSP